MNPRRRKWVTILAFVAFCGWLFINARGVQLRSSAQQAAPPPNVSPPGGREGWLGTASCSGRACHGGLGSAGTKGCEYTTFMLQEDPHTKAFLVLDSERSRLMVKNLRGKDLDPRKDDLCLSCHGPATFAAGPKLGADDGFGCESCHGPAKKWLGPHTATATWSKLSDRQKRDLGFQPMDTMVDRARACTACHVGSGNRDVNHDLIAAGHPRLNFEFDTYLTNLPSHWRPERAKERASAWQVGQLVSAEAALELLAYRADSKNGQPWPEFAEYDCFACHHDLKAKSWRQQRGYADRVPGALPWSDWYAALPRFIDRSLSDARQTQEGFAALRAEMSKPMPDRSRVATEARALAKLLSNSRLPRTSAFLSEFHKTLPRLMADDPPSGFFVRNKDGVGVANWDIAAQLALGLQAEYSARVSADPAKRDPAIEKSLHELFELLRFSKTGTFDSPVAFDSRAVAKQLQDVAERLGE
jgi:hypothetical protein